MIDVVCLAGVILCILIMVSCTVPSNKNVDIKFSAHDAFLE